MSPGGWFGCRFGFLFGKKARPSKRISCFILSPSARDRPGDTLHRGGQDESVLGHGGWPLRVGYSGGAAAIHGVAMCLGVLLAQVGWYLEGCVGLCEEPSGMCPRGLYELSSYRGRLFRELEQLAS